MMGLRQRIWMITGSSSGLGKALVEGLYGTGNIIIPTFRNQQQVAAFDMSRSDASFAVQMDLRDPTTITAAFELVKSRCGRLDVLINNAGVGLFGAIEEVREDDVREQFNVNVFGTLATTQAALPLMRKQRSGYIIQMSSVSGVQAIAGLGIYAATKYALEGFSEALSDEVRHLGIHVVICEPGPFRTEWIASAREGESSRSIADYGPTAHAAIDRLLQLSGNQEGDPAKAARAIIEVCNMPHPPLRVPLGRVANMRIREKLARSMGEVEMSARLFGDLTFD